MPAQHAKQLAQRTVTKPENPEPLCYWRRGALSLLPTKRDLVKSRRFSPRFIRFILPVSLLRTRFAKRREAMGSSSKRYEISRKRHGTHDEHPLSLNAIPVDVPFEASSFIRR